MTPLVLVMPGLEQEFRADFDFMNQGISTATWAGGAAA
jgi:hypothetical protein